MAIRYSGGLKINVVYQDRGDYRAVITEYGPEASHRRHPMRMFHTTPRKAIVYVRPPAAGFGRGIAYDSPEAYDQTAHAALSFASDEWDNEWISNLASHDADFSGWHIGRTESQAWPKP